MCSGKDVTDFALTPVGLQIGGASGANAVHNTAQRQPLSKNAKAAGAADAVGAGAALALPAGAGGALYGTPGAEQLAGPGMEAGSATAGAAPATGAASGALTVKDVAMTAAAIAGTASAAYSLYAAKNAPKPPGTEPPPPVPQPGRQPDFIGARKKNLFGDDGPFARDSTFLTGPGGVASGSTNLGRNILLGS